MNYLIEKQPYSSFCPPMIEENDCKCICFAPFVYCVHYNKIINNDICRFYMTCFWCIEDPNSERHCICCIKDPNTCRVCNLGGGIGPFGFSRSVCFPFCCENNHNNCFIETIICLSLCK